MTIMNLGSSLSPVGQLGLDWSLVTASLLFILLRFLLFQRKKTYRRTPNDVSFFFCVFGWVMYLAACIGNTWALREEINAERAFRDGRIPAVEVGVLTPAYFKVCLKP
jgi:hypothetical protein